MDLTLLIGTQRVELAECESGVGVGGMGEGVMVGVLVGGTWVAVAVGSGVAVAAGANIPEQPANKLVSVIKKMAV